jgi:hypothetical protein
MVASKKPRDHFSASKNQTPFIDDKQFSISVPVIRPYFQKINARLFQR